jgi:flagellar assembly factor FliW
MTVAAESNVVTTTRFGDLDVDPSKIIDFPRGILGFEAHGRFVLVDQPEIQPFVYLQSLDDPALAFIVVDPRLVFPNYKVHVEPQEIADLNVRDVKSICMWVIVTVPSEVSKMSANLQGPILVNQENNCAKQVVLMRSSYTTRHYLMDELSKTKPESRRTPVQAVHA